MPEARTVSARRRIYFASVRLDAALHARATGWGLSKGYFDARERLRARLEGLDLAPARRSGAIFLHIPKCGGTSIERQLGIEWGHRSAVYFRARDPALFARAFTFTLVRNPYDRLVSGFHYLKNHTRSPRDRDWARAALAGIDDFATFLQALAEPRVRDRVLSWLHFLPQWFFVCDRQGRLLVDAAYRLEEMEDRLGEIAARIGQPLENRRARVSDRAHFAHYYTPEAAAAVAALYARDFALFGYDPALPAGETAADDTAEDTADDTADDTAADRAAPRRRGRA